MIDLTNQEMFQQIQERGQTVILEDDFRQALTFTRNMNKLLMRPEGQRLAENPERLAAYRQLLNQLSFICLSALDDRTLSQLFEEHILIGIKLPNIDLVAKMKAKLVAIPSFAERDVLRRRLRESLLRNQERLGVDTINLDDKSSSPAVANWLRKYSSVVGPKPATAVQQNQFIVTDPDVKKLDSASLSLLRGLVALFEYLKLSSQTPDGLEDPVVFRFGNQLRVLKQGNFEDVKLPPKLEQMIDRLAAEEEGPKGPAEKLSSAADTSDVILTAYQGDAKQYQAILKEQEKIAKKVQDKPDQLSAIFYQAVQSKNIVATVAALRLMAEQDRLGIFLKTDEKLNKFLSLTWEKQYGKALVDEFARKPNQLKFIKLFLQYVLQQRLELTSNDAARIGLQIANIFVKAGKKEYNRLAFFDVKTKTFKWF